MKLPRRHKNKIVVKKFNNQTGDSEVILLAFNGKIRDKIIQNFNKQYLIEGDHIQNGGKSSTKTILSLMGTGAGSLGITGATSGQLFMATANTATLMQMGGGVGSAVMGAGGIIAQAPFVAVSSALMPVVAPLIAFQAISTITIMNEFKIVHQKLDIIQKAVNRLIKREEAVFIGEIISASNRIAEIEDQYAISNQFTNDMMIRLSLLEDKVNPIFERYNYLYQDQSIDKDMSMEDLKFKKVDAFMAIMTSILDVRIDLLKIKLNIQENPGYMKKSSKQFENKIEYYNGLWTTIRDNADDIKEISNEMSDVIENMNFWQYNITKRKERKTLSTKSAGFEKEGITHKADFKEPVKDAIELGNIVKKSLNSDSQMNLVYWQDENGEHSYYTDDLLIE